MPGGGALREFIARYLSARHRDEPGKAALSPPSAARSRASRPRCAGPSPKGCGPRWGASRGCFRGAAAAAGEGGAGRYGDAGGRVGARSGGGRSRPLGADPGRGQGPPGQRRAAVSLTAGFRGKALGGRATAERDSRNGYDTNATVAVIGAGDFIGAAIAKRFAAGGYAVFAGRRNGEKLAPAGRRDRGGGRRCAAARLDARKEEAVAAFLAEAERSAPLEVCIFNVGANVNFPILETTERVFRKVWEMACYAGFLTGREAARLMLPRGRGSIFFTGATASLRGGAGYAAFASAKFGLRAVAQSMARELGPKNIHVAHLIIDAGVDTAFVRERRRAAPARTASRPTS